MIPNIPGLGNIMPNFGAGGGIFAGVTQAAGMLWNIFKYTWWLLILVYGYFWRSKWHILGVIITRRGNSDSVSFDFAKNVVIKDPSTGLNVKATLWRARKRITERLPLNCIYGSNWGFATSFVREGVNGEMIPTALVEDKNPIHLRPLDADVEAIRQERYLFFLKFHNTEKLALWKKQEFWNVAFAVIMLLCMYIVLDKIGALTGALTAAADGFAKAMGH